MLFDIMGYISEGQYQMMLIHVSAILFVVFCTLPVHEFAHAWMAVRLGDDTPRLSGRLTLRPMAHIDPFGALMIFLLGFGYAKPVPVNLHNLKNGRTSFALVAFAGPASNLIMAFIFLLCKSVADAIYVNLAIPATVYTSLAYFFVYAATINISLAVFNLLPIPPLDGSRIFNLILPEKYYYTVMRYERYIRLGLFVLLWTGILSTPLSWLSDIVYNGFSWVAQLPFKLAGLL